MRIIGIIPARYASSRFPGKPLVMIDGKSMIRRVYEQAIQSREISELYVATDHQAIEKHVADFGGKVIMTSPQHQNGTERCNEVLEKLSGMNAEIDIIINIQGDEPFIDPGQISLLAGIFNDPQVQIATLIKKISSPDELDNPDVVKVIADKYDKAICFSRFALPYFRGVEKGKWLEERSYFKHIGIYGYRAKTLSAITRLPVSSLEVAECLEQLRWIDHGYSIHVCETPFDSIAIDSPADLLKITNIH
jgi:3-deoxy-manno-octulosonate cytidylyltransferase (CMP-KDO synthetase)